VRATVIVIAVALLALLRSLPPVAANWAEPAPEELGAEVVALLNEARAAAGLAGLEELSLLRDAAATRALEMATTGAFAHTRPNGGTVEGLLRDYGVPYSMVGENIARSNEALDRVVMLVHSAQMTSEGHRANVLEPEFGHVGVGIARVGNVYYFALIFTD
jgi:uncharacterized protein YkwD